MKRNFALPDGAHLTLNDRLIDIHNLYSVQAASWSLDRERFEVRLGRNSIESTVPPNQPEQLTLICEGEVKLVFNDLALRNRPLESDGINTIGYFDGHCDEWGSFILEDMLTSRTPQGIVLLFEWDFDLRIHCQQAIASAS